MSNASINAQAERVTQPFWGSADAASADPFQNVTSQLLGFFRAQGCVLPIAEELALKITGELAARVREVLRRPGLGASWISGVIQVGDLKLLGYGGELEYLGTYICALRKKIEKNPANPEYIVSEPWIGYRFRVPAASESASFQLEQPAAFNSRSAMTR